MFFQFEQDFVNSLRCIPMQVRLKLDTCGVKLKLHHWNQFSQNEREELVKRSCQTQEEITGYRDYLQQLVTHYTGSPAKELDIDPNPPWLDETQIPQQIQDKAAEFNVKVTPKQWQQLLPLQRFALLKLSRPSHENQNFYPALQEFGLVS